MTTLERAFGVKTLVGYFDQHADALVKDDLPTVKLFKMGRKPNRVEGDAAYFDKRVFKRRLAPLGGRDDTPHEIVKPEETEIKVGLLHTQVSQAFYPSELFIDRRGLGELKANAAARVATAVDEGISYVRRSQEKVTSSIMLSAGGAVTVDSTLIPNTSIADSITYSDIQTLAVAEKWDVDTAALLSGENQLQAAKKKLADAGYSPEFLIHTDVAARGLYGNDEVKDWLHTNNAFNVNYLTQYIPGYDQAAARKGKDPFAGGPLNGVGAIPQWLQWDHGYDDEDAADAFTKFYDDTKAVMVGDSLDNIVGFAEGPALIPAGVNVIGGAEAADLIAKRDGIVAYAYLEPTPPWRIVVVVSCHWVPYVLDGKGIVTLTKIS